MTSTIIPLIIFLFPLAFSPGPGNMFFAANGARFGLVATLWANLGYHIATWLVTFGIGFGFLTAINRYPQVFGFLQVIGALYVLWIAWNMARAGNQTGQTLSKPAGFWDGVVLLLVNPKAYVIITLMFSQFLTGLETNRLLTIVLISSVFTANNTLAFLFWASTGDVLARRFRSPSSAAKLNLTFGAILAAVAVWMLVF